MLIELEDQNFFTDKLKKKFLIKRQQIKQKFFSENKSLKSCLDNSRNIDNLIIQMFNFLSKDKKYYNSFLSVCAVGGYGRKMLAPYSDLDILFIYKKDLDSKKIKKIVEFILFPLWDLGFKIGYAVRNLEESISLSESDHIIQTSMLDCRLICGSKSLYQNVLKYFKLSTEKNGFRLLEKKILERKKRIIEIGYDYFRNEPNLKESEGSLRDINLIFWGLKIFNLSNQKNSSHLLTAKERRKLRKSLEFLLLLRCHLHYQSKRANDKFSFDYQIAISKQIFKPFNKKEETNVFVEKMMKIFFQQISFTKNLAEIFSGTLEMHLKKSSNKGLLLMPNKKPSNLIYVFLKKLYQGKENAYDQRLILEFLNKFDKNEIVNFKNLILFKKILFSKKKKTFVNLYDLGIVSKIIPEFSKITYLPQFDRYHSLTVGQHTLKAVNILKDLLEKKVKKKSYQFFYKEIKKDFNRKALYFATLLHDIGKGRGGNHNFRGAITAKKIVLRFNESEATANETSWLVCNHSLLSSFAFKKDLEDHSIIRNISQKIEKISRLRTLFLLTVTDISAVDQGLWNNWKSSLLQKLFIKIEKQLKNPKKLLGLNEKIERIKLNIFRSSKKITISKFKQISKIAYPNYWLLQSEKMIVFQIENFFVKPRNAFDFVIKKSDELEFFDLILVTRDREQLFLNIISILASENLSVFEARIFTLDDGTVIDTFKFSFDRPNIFNKNDSMRIIESTKKKLKLLGSGKYFKPEIKEESKLRIIKKQVNVEIDNNSSATYTILIVKTNDRPKLLYDISKILIKNKIIISMAKISTNGDFVEDSFHLRSQYGLKIRDIDIINGIVDEIKKKLKQKLENVS
tara:strand:+ start:707 stop:3268 length:2562 start_codon:yes stop_codon:yes gene_type:complete